MATSGGRPSAGVPVAFDEHVWAEEVERFAPRSAARLAAERARAEIERYGIPRSELRRCAPSGEDGTRLLGCFKAYVPLHAPAPSGQRFGLVGQVTVTNGSFGLRLLAFGERHPVPPERSVYERAHKRLHGSYQDE